MRDHVCGFLRDHQDGGDRIAIWHERKHGRVRDSEIRHAAHAKFRIHDGCWIVVRPHLARARLMVLGSSRRSHVTLPIRVAAEVITVKKGKKNYNVSMEIKEVNRLLRA